MIILGQHIDVMKYDAIEILNFHSFGKSSIHKDTLIRGFICVDVTLREPNVNYRLQSEVDGKGST